MSNNIDASEGPAVLPFWLRKANKWLMPAVVLGTFGLALLVARCHMPQLVIPAADPPSVPAQEQTAPKPAKPKASVPVREPRPRWQRVCEPDFWGQMQCRWELKRRTR